MEKVFLDSDVFIDLLRAHKSRIKDIFEKVESKEIIAYTSWINIVELYSGIDSEYKDSIIRDILSMCEVIENNLESARLAGDIRKKFHLGIADSIVASLVVLHDVKLFTFNFRDFKKVKELKFYSF